MPAVPRHTKSQSPSIRILMAECWKCLEGRGNHLHDTSQFSHRLMVFSQLSGCIRRSFACISQDFKITHSSTHPEDTTSNNSTFNKTQTNWLLNYTINQEWEEGAKHTVKEEVAEAQIPSLRGNRDASFSALVQNLRLPQFMQRSWKFCNFVVN